MLILHDKENVLYSKENILREFANSLSYMLTTITKHEYKEELKRMQKVIEEELER